MTIFIVGHLCLDTIIINDEQRPISMGGTASFSSIVCSRLGAPEKVFIISKVGDDFPDHFLVHLQSNGIDTQYIHRVRRNSTRYELNYFDDERALTLKSVCAPIIGDDFPPEIYNASLIYFGPIANEIPIETIIAIKQQSNSLVAIDIQGMIRHRDAGGKLFYKSGPKIEEMLSSIDVIKLDLKEAEILTGASKIRDIAAYLSSVGVELALITKSRKGSALFYRGKIVKIPAIILPRIYDETGAGDCYFSSFLIEYMKTKEPIHSAQFAAKAVSYMIGSPNGIQNFLIDGDIYTNIENFVKENQAG